LKLKKKESVKQIAQESIIQIISLHFKAKLTLILATTNAKYSTL